MTDLPKDKEDLWEANEKLWEANEKIPNDFTWTNDESWRFCCASIARTMDALSNRTTPGWADSLITAITIAEPGNEEARGQILEKIYGFTEGASP